MDLKELKELLELFEQRENISELELQKDGFRIRLKKGEPTSYATARVSLPIIQDQPAAVQSSPPGDLPAGNKNCVAVKSPIVGTFFRAPAPDADPFVQVNDIVEKGQVLCIVEAMKLMNEIESEVYGRIMAVLVDISHPVEYGETLFLIEPL
ncbi:MAG: acetyl-CoA carboxylase biotin carboxyl carrier protein [Candidatus Tectomicrobia bacterium]|uniref:Biotin carboxyl carrier protein of acetyl-CoA carboxylase n=1 Tax=Tectimicrobiota bacterium TaxID=2528274 RepID=A0A932FVV7_UNCTE|nr:acetyl-CoA carboxylase biotin carboxyl carrier protein [Candidatus Tectomicrobia bacterium]